MSITAHAESELRKAGTPEDEIKAHMETLARFFGEYDSGGAVWAMQDTLAPPLRRLVAGKPLSPLTGADDEWMDHGGGVFQNVRCGSVFKDPRFHDGKMAYDIDATEPRGAITFPYWPDSDRVASPVMVIETQD